MFEVQDSEDIVIEWDMPRPPKPMRFRHTETVWYKRLKPMMKFPGRTARIARKLDSSYDAAKIKSSIMRSLYNQDPYERWETATAKDDDGTFGVWVTYQGRMSEQEYVLAEKQRLERQDKRNRQLMHNRMIRQQEVGRSSLAASLRPPVIDLD